MKLPRLRRRSLAALAVALTAAVLVPAQPASAAPAITASVAPQSGPTAGGTPIRIYGTGFSGTDPSVQFDNVNATDFRVVDDTLVTAVVPAAAGGSADNNTFVDVKVTAGGATATQIDGIFYTNATFAVTGANPPFSAGDPITTTLDGYKASTSMAVPQFNPLLVYVENYPDFPFGPPPYAEVLATGTTDSNGDLTVNTNLASGTFGDPSYDANIACPVNQTTVDYLGTSDSVSLSKPAYSGHCMVANGQFGVGTLERAIDMTNDPSPTAETLAISPTTDIDPTETVTVSGVRWNANPFFGSSKLADNPGETTVTLEICDSATNTCSATKGNATVTPTRYIYNSGTGVFGFSGATLSGTIVVGNDVPAPCTTCFVRVKQNRPASGSIQETLAIPIG